MAWLGRVSLGGFPDLAGAVTKLSESVKNIEKNFDSALGLEDKPDTAPGEASGIWPTASDRKALFDPVMAFMGHRGDDTATEPSGNAESSENISSANVHDKISSEDSLISMSEITAPAENDQVDSEIREKENDSRGEVSREKENDSHGEVNREKENDSHGEVNREKENDSRGEVIISNVSGESHEKKYEAESDLPQPETDVSVARNIKEADSVVSPQQEEGAEMGTSEESQLAESKQISSDESKQVETNVISLSNELCHVNDTQESYDKEGTEVEKLSDKASPKQADVLDNKELHFETDSSDATPTHSSKNEKIADLSDGYLLNASSSEKDLATLSNSVSHGTDSTSRLVEVVSQAKYSETANAEKSMSTGMNKSVSEESFTEVERLKKEMKQMEAALQGAARQSQAKADEIARMMNENEQLKSIIEDLKRKSSESEVDALRDEYHQRVASLERKVYALTRERDTLRREQSRKSDAAALLKEKDEIISQVMAEGEELSKKQAAQESTIRKLRAQIRELEEEKQRLNSKLQVEESKVESIKRDKAATEKLLQETIERNQAELAAQKEFYTNALNAAKEAEALAEARANNEARIELESRLREAGEREAMLVQALEELRQTLSRTEQQAVFREDMLRKDIDDLQKRYQASELRYNELIAQVPESTRPLLRQIEAMQETTARRAEAWAGVERALNSRLQEAEAKAAAAEERERSINERLSQTLSRIAVLETQIACLRTEQTQLSRSLEKERQRASENRQEYLAAIEEAATQEGRAKQLEDEIRDIRSKYKQELQEEVAHRELLEKELERERAARSELEKSSHEISLTADQGPMIKLTGLNVENGNAPLRKLSSAGSLSSMEESVFLQASLDSSDSFLTERKISGETSVSPYFLKSMTPSAFEAALRQKDGELASYMSRLASLESIRDSLAEELVKMTAQCEKLRAEAALLPSVRAELEALRRRHSSALELMGERDEELEELRADIIDLKEMYREQVDLLVNRIQMMSSSAGAS